MNIIIDAMGGDNAPGEIIRGACDASLRLSSDLTLVGQRDVIEKHLSEHDKDMSRISIFHADDVLSMEDDPISVVRTKKGSSMAEGFRLLNESGDAFISAGNTGALHTGATLIVKNIKGVRRAAISTVLPFERPALMMDCGANVNVTPDNFLQWAILGSVYMRDVTGVKKPEVGLLNIGTEESKGTDIHREAYRILSESADISFVGNVEAKQIPFGACDILLADGFTGNVVLKLIEGMASFMFGELKKMFTHSAVTKLSYLAMKDQLRGMKRSFDAAEYGGAPILGISKPVIKAHGSSDARAIFNAVRQAELFCTAGVIGKVEDAVERMRQGT